MEREITKLFTILNGYETKFPNIVKVNCDILEFHVKKLKESIEQCYRSIENIKNIDKDYTKKELVTFYKTMIILNQVDLLNER
jgi:hypothetical protein